MRANVYLVSIECTKEGVKFACSGDIGSGSVILKQDPSLEKESEAVLIEMNEPVSLTFSLKYLTNFCKASGLSDSVKLCLSSEVPLLVEYALQLVCMRVVPSGIVFVFLVRHLAPMILSLRLNSAWLEDTKEMGKMTTDTHMGLLLVRHQLRMSMQ